MEAPWLPTPKKFKRVFFSCQGIIMADYLEDGRTINGACYADELRLLCQKIVKKWRGKMAAGVLLLQVNAPANTSPVASGISWSLPI